VPGEAGGARPALRRDLDGIRAIEAEVFGTDPYPGYFFRQALELWGELAWVWETGANELAGYALGAASTEPEVAWILSVGVRPAHRGAGVARAHTEAHLDTLRARSVREVRLTVHPENQQARNLYRSLGFTPMLEDPEYFGSGEPRLVMRLKLDL
jgi:ribosomal protein S18 acetylase RimI-like enzyme